MPTTETRPRTPPAQGAAVSPDPGPAVRRSCRRAGRRGFLPPAQFVGRGAAVHPDPGGRPPGRGCSSRPSTGTVLAGGIPAAGHLPVSGRWTAAPLSTYGITATISSCNIPPRQPLPPGLLQGLWHLVSSFTQDYTSFICLFTEFPFCLTGHTGDSYVKSMAVSVLPSLLAALGAVVCKSGADAAGPKPAGLFPDGTDPIGLLALCAAGGGPGPARLAGAGVRPDHPGADPGLPL